MAGRGEELEALKQVVVKREPAKLHFVSRRLMGVRLGAHLAQNMNGPKTLGGSWCLV